MRANCGASASSAGSTPAGLLDQVQRTHFERPATADTLRGEAALGMAAADPEEAAAIAETIADPAARAGTLVDLADATPAADRARKLALLDGAALQARTAAISSDKLFQMGEVAERWLELGEAEKAKTLFAEGRKLVEAEPLQSRTNAGLFPSAPGAGRARSLPVGLIENVGQRRWRDRSMATSRSGWPTSIRLRPRRCSTASMSRSGGSTGASRGFAAGWPGATSRLPVGSPDLLPNPTERACMPGSFLADGLADADRTAAGAALERALREIDSIDAAGAAPISRTEPRRVDPAIWSSGIAPERVAEALARSLALRAPGDDPRTDFGSDQALAVRGRADVPLRPRQRRRSSFEPVGSLLRRPARSAMPATSSPACSSP